MEKHADAIPYAQALQTVGTGVGIPPAQGFMQSLGGGDIWTGFGGRGPLVDRLAQMQLGQNILASGGAQWNQDTQQEVASTLRGLLSLMGVDWTPEVQQQLNTVLSSMPAQFAGPWLNRLLGHPFGEGVPIAEAIHRGAAAQGLSPAQVAPIATAVSKALDQDPSLRAGLSTDELSQAILEGTRRRRLTALDPTAFKEQLKAITQPLAAVRAQALKTGQRFDVAQAWRGIEQGGGFDDPINFMQQLRVGQYALEEGGPAGIFGAAATAGGQPLRMSPEEIAAGRSQIWNRIQRHPMTYMAAATARIASEFGLKPGSRGESMAKAMMQGTMPRSYDEWSNAMRGSIATAGVTPDEIYHQFRYNKARYLQDNPVLQNALMAGAMTRWAPRVANIYGALGGNSPVMQMRRNRALNMMAEQAGFRSNPRMSAWDQMRYLTGYGPQSVAKMKQYTNRAQTAQSLTGVGEVSPQKRLVDVLQGVNQPGGTQSGWEAFKSAIGYMSPERIQAQAPTAQLETVPGLPSLEHYKQQAKPNITLRPPAAPAAPAVPAPAAPSPV